MSGEVVEGETSTDTYETARAVTEQQIAKENAVHAANDAIESDVLGLWDEFIEIPYGNLTLRIRADLPSQKHDAFMRFVNTIGGPDCDPSGTFPMLTLGLYKDDSKVHDTDLKFWSNPGNMSVLKINQIVGAYMKNYKKEVELTTSFLND